MFDFVRIAVKLTGHYVSKTYFKTAIRISNLSVLRVEWK